MEKECDVPICPYGFKDEKGYCRCPFKRYCNGQCAYSGEPLVLADIMAQMANDIARLEREITKLKEEENEQKT